MARPTAIVARPTRVVETPGGPVHIVVSQRDDGDFNCDHVAPDQMETTRRRLIDLPWTLLDERHGTAAVRVTRPGEHDGAAGDAAVTAVHGAVLGIWVGDCAPVVLVAPSGEFGVVHAGWRGLAAGVLTAGIGAFDEPPDRAVLGPVLRSCCNEFGADDLRFVAGSLGVEVEEVSAVTTWGTTSLDLPACVGHELDRHAVALDDLGLCTGCDPSYFSNRMRADAGRHVVAAVRTTW